VTGWHFVGDTLRDRRPIPADGEWLEHSGDLRMCESGLHASERIIDALQYAPGSTICCVEIDGEMLTESDKVCARRRKILWRIDGDEILRAFARGCALQVIHLWDAPAVVREYLETGDETKRVAAGAAAWAAAWVAAGAAAWAAAGAAAGDTAMGAARAAAWDTAWAAARAAARAAAWAAARAAAWDTARGAARAAAVAAAWAAAWGAQNDKLTEMVMAVHAKEVEP